MLGLYRKTLLFLSFILICISQLRAQHINHLGVEDGLNGRQAFNIVQDKKGFLWIATRFGVDRFDGANIKNYEMDILYNGSIPIRSIHVILDRDSVLWAYTNRGTIYKYMEDQDEFISRVNVSMYFRTIHFDHENRIWAMSQRELGYIEGDDLHSLKKLPFGDEALMSLCDYDKEHLLILSSKNVYKYHKATNHFLSLIDDTTIKNTAFESFYYDSCTNNIWIGSDNNGLFLYNISENRLHHMKEPRLQQYLIRNIVPFDSTYIMLGTEGLGACLFNTETLHIEKIYSRGSDYATRINDNVIYDIYKDRNNRVWLSCFSDGVNMLDFAERGFQVMRHEEGNPNSLSRNTVCDILEDSDGNMWFATNNDLCLWNKKTNQWKRLLDSKNILTLYEDSRQNIWVGTFTSGVYVLDKQGNIVRNYVRHPGQTNTIHASFIYTITEDSEGNIWLGGKRGHVSRLNPYTHIFTSVPVSQANHIIQKDAGHMLVSTEAGVYEVSLDGQHVSPCFFNTVLKSQYISDMFMESDSILWLGTYGDGLNRCNLVTQTINRYTRNEGLPSDIIHAFELDQNRNLWFTSENGIGSLNLNTYEIANFSQVDGIAGERFRQLSKAKSGDGKIYFGSYSGVTYFNPDDIHKDESGGVLYLEDFWLFNQIVKPGDKKSPIRNTLDKTDQIKLSYKQHSFSISFLAIDYSLGQKRKYMWKLDNMDQNWVGPTTEHIANYTNLSPNEYNFHVRYLDESNRILDERVVKITVTPPFWQTGWARILFAFIIAVIAYLIYRYVEQQIKKKQSEEKIRFFINTAHDIRTPLTLINGPIYELQEQIEHSKKNDYLLGLITDNLNKLNKMFSQLLDFQKAYESKDQLVVRETDVKKYLDGRLPYWKSSAAKKQLILSLELPDEPVMEWFDPDKVDKILDNLISNAIKYTPEKGEIKIKLTTDTNHWKITVSDNGIGISKQERNNLFQRFYRASNAINSQVSGSGLGLLLVKKYMALHNGSAGFTSVENQGSDFYVQFSKGRKHFQDNILLDDNDIPILHENGSQEVIDTGKLKIKLLIVEDNKDLRGYLRLSLNPYYNIYTSENGARAWENIQKINPDIVISDLQMPEMDGFELCEKIKNTFETSHIPVILLTVVNDKQHVIKGFHLGLDDYIEKPFDVKYLKLKVDNIIQNRKLLRQKFLGIDKEQTLLADQETENAFNVKFIKKATEIIESNLTNPQFTIAEFSKEMGLSRTLLFTKFNSITGYTPNDFIKTIRMKRAIAYFKEKKYTINEVALKVGFEEPAYFSTCFKKIYGKSPKQFIEENIG